MEDKVIEFGPYRIRILEHSDEHIGIIVYQPDEKSPIGDLNLVIPVNLDSAGVEASNL